MKNQPATDCGKAVSLYQMVNKLQYSLLSTASSKKSFIVNDIDRTVALPVEENALAHVIGNLLSNAVNSTSDCCIRIETSSKDNQLQIRIRNNSAFVYSSYVHIPANFLDAAQKIGGNIGLESEPNSALTLVLSVAIPAAA